MILQVKKNGSERQNRNNNKKTWLRKTELELASKITLKVEHVGCCFQRYVVSGKRKGK